MPTPRAFWLSSCKSVCVLLLGFLSVSASFGADLQLPLALDYRVLEQALEKQLFGGAEHTAEIYSDRIKCNNMVLSKPRIQGTDAGEVLIYTTITAQHGTPIGSRCLLKKTWHGILKTVHQAEVDPRAVTVDFTVVDSRVLRSDEVKSAIPDWLQNLVMNLVLPRLEAIVIDLRPAVSGIQELIDSVTTAGPEVAAMVSSLQIMAAKPSLAALEIVLSLEVPDAPVFEQPEEETSLTEEELARWDSAWQAWDGFLTWFILTTAASGADEELVQALADTLLIARYELRDALENDDRNHDPVRVLFLNTWERLAPLLHASRLELPGSEALQFATFIAAGDALSTLDQVAPYVGLQLDTQSLRHFARLMVPAVTESELEYNRLPNPDLRRLLGLDPELELEAEPEPEPETEEGRAETSIFDWFIPTARAQGAEKKPVRQLHRWVPKRNELDEYLALVTRLLDKIATSERAKKKVPAEHFELYKTLLLATAWQESCWRQFIEKDGEVETLQSYAGSVGMMQVNKYVWRGVYDVDALMNNMDYNARSGNEILVHYLVDYAIRKREHTTTGDPDNLVRATYAAYNGGPGHLSRYRKPYRNESLKLLDDAFWEKFLAIQKNGPAAVKECYRPG